MSNIACTEVDNNNISSDHSSIHQMVKIRGYLPDSTLGPAIIRSRQSVLARSKNISDFANLASAVDAEEPPVLVAIANTMLSTPRDEWLTLAIGDALMALYELQKCPSLIYGNSMPVSEKKWLARSLTSASEGRPSASSILAVHVREDTRLGEGGREMARVLS
jgi:hypothetical protein